VVFCLFYKDGDNMNKNRINLSLEQILEAKKNSNSAAEAARYLGVSPQTFARRSKELGVYETNQGLKGTKKPKNTNIDFRKYSCNDFVFSELTPEGAYWLGFIAADGCIREEKNCICVVLKREDKGHLEKLKKFLKFDGKIFDRVRVVNEIEYPISELTFFSKDIVKDFVVKYNITKRKSYKKINTVDLISEELILYFIIGFFDGDGNISKLDGVSSITSRDRYIIYFIQKFLEENYSIKSSVSFRNKKNVYSLSIHTKENVYKFIKLYLSVSNIVSLLERKQKIAEKYLRYNGLS